MPRNGFIFGDEKGPWSIDGITDVLTKVTETQLSIRITTQIYRQISVAIDRKFMRGVDLELDSDEDEAHDLMAAHSTAMTLNRYGRLDGLIKELTPESIDIFRGISGKWQSWFELVSRLPRNLVTVKCYMSLLSRSFLKSSRSVLCPHVQRSIRLYDICLDRRGHYVENKKKG